ncbi:MAG: hypothetical protein ACREP1_13530, partial [Rhodanobacteraceae bacterium]
CDLSGVDNPGAALDIGTDENVHATILRRSRETSWTRSVARSPAQCIEQPLLKLALRFWHASPGPQ